MFAMDQIHRIRGLYYQQDMNLSDIAKLLDCDWRTVKKYVAGTDLR